MDIFIHTLQNINIFVYCSHFCCMMKWAPTLQEQGPANSREQRNYFICLSSGFTKDYKLLQGRGHNPSIFSVHSTNFFSWYLCLHTPTSCPVPPALHWKCIPNTISIMHSSALKPLMDSWNLWNKKIVQFMITLLISCCPLLPIQTPTRQVVSNIGSGWQERTGVRHRSNEMQNCVQWLSSLACRV